jgi:hypothetical protein
VLAAPANKTAQFNPMESFLMSLWRYLSLPFKMLRYSMQFIRFNTYKRQYYFNKLKMNIKQYGYIHAFKRTFMFFSQQSHGDFNATAGLIQVEKKNSIGNYCYKLRIAAKYIGIKKFIRLGMNKIFKREKGMHNEY